MKLIKKIIRKTLTYKIYDTLYSVYTYIKDMLYISDVLYSKEFNAVVKQYLNVSLKRDWIGRLYGVINPNIDIDGHFTFNNNVIELDDVDTNNTEYVKAWVHQQLHMIGYLFKINKLYDYINLEFKHVGPVEYDNYLLIFDIVSRKELIYSFNTMFKHLVIYIILVSLILCAKIYIF